MRPADKSAKRASCVREHTEQATDGLRYAGPHCGPASKPQAGHGWPIDVDMPSLRALLHAREFAQTIRHNLGAGLPQELENAIDRYRDP